PVTGVPLYTDARHYAAASIPIVLYGAGPRSIREANAHNANENLRLEDLRAATNIVAMAAADLLGTRGVCPRRRGSNSQRRAIGKARKEAAQPRTRSRSPLCSCLPGRHRR